MKKCISMFLCTLMVVLNFQIVSIRPASAALVTKTPTQDAIWDVGGKWPDEPLNYVGYSADNDYGVQRSAVQFDLSDINASVGQAKFRFFVTENQDLTPSDPFIPFVTLYGSSIDSWGTTFPLDAGDLPLYIGRTDIPQGQWREFDVTNFVNSQISTDKKVTFALLGQETVPGAQFNFAGRTYPDASKRPQLVLIPPALQPTVTSTVTAEDTQSGSGLIITKDVADSSSVTHFKISGITGGTLYKNDGTTVIHDGNFITVAEGGAGLKFTPAPDANSPTGGIFGFKVQAAWDSSGSGLSNAAQVAITVTEVNDPPVAVNDSLSSIEADSGARTIPFATLLANDSPGPANESGQVLTITSVDSPVGGTVSISGSNVIFTPSANYHGPASFRYTVQDNGTTNGSANPKTAQATASFTINAPAVKNITAVSPPAAKTGIANGTAKIVSALGLPAQVGVTLSDSSTTNVDVVWDVAGSSYDPSQKTSQTFTVTGTLTNLPSNITNSTNKTASISVTVDAEPTKNITAVSTPPAKTGIANGTDKTVSALGLPAQVGVTLSDNSTANVDVIWDVGGSSYDPSQKTSQTFTVSGTLTNLPSNITNSTNKTTSISVTVDAEPTKDITAVSTPTAKTGIANGTDKTATALGLPAQVGVTLSDSSTTNIDVIWDVASSSYDPSQKTSQTFTVTGTLTNLPNTITNSANKTASISVTVDAEPTKDITAVSTPTARTGVANGSAKTVAALGLPAQVGVTLSDSSTTNVDVIWDVASSSYDPSQKTPQTFTVTGTLTNLPNTITNSANKTASISVTVDAEPTKDITAVSTPTARTGIANGSAKTVSALGLPAQVGVTLSDSSTANVDVIWDVGGSSYDPSQKTSQTFTVSGTLTNLPSNITNSTNKTTSISVTVDAEPTKDITAVSTPTAKTGIANGSAKTVSALGLPAQVGVTLSDNSTANVDVIWDVGGSSYDPSQKTSQTFTVSGTLTNLPSNITNSTNKTASISVTVEAATTTSDTISVTGVSLDQSSLSLTVGGATGTLIATVLPADATNKTILWSSSNPNVATVVGGVVTPLQVGTTTITATSQADPTKQATSLVMVEAATTTPDTISVTGVLLDQSSLNLTAGGGTGTLTATVFPADATNKTILWSSSDPTVATVANGVITPLKAGTTTITVTTVDGSKTASCIITVNQPSSGGGGGGGGGSSNGGSSGNSNSTPSTPTTNPNMGIDISITEAGVIKDRIPNVVQVSNKKADDGRSMTTLTISNEYLEKVAGVIKSGESVVVSAKSLPDTSAIQVEVTAKALSSLAEKNASLSIQTKEAAIQLPARALQIEKVAEKLGVAAEQVKVNITITKPTVQVAQQAAALAEKMGAKVLVEPIQFSVTATANNQKLDSNKFGNQFITQSVVLNPAQQINPMKAVAVIVENGKLHPVPARFMDGKAEIHTTRNGTIMIMERTETFTDISNHWAQKDIEALANKLIVTGMGDQKFHPNDNITRAEFAAFMVRALGLEDHTARNERTFTDVSADAWYSSVVTTATEAGIFKGVTQEQFAPNELITREQMAAVLVRASKKFGLPLKSEASTPTISDLDHVSSWAKDEVAEAIQAGIMKGNPNGTVTPGSTGTRAQGAVLIKGLLQKTELIN